MPFDPLAEPIAWVMPALNLIAVVLVAPWLVLFLFDEFVEAIQKLRSSSGAPR